MPTRNSDSPDAEVIELLRSLLIVQLALAGTPSASIRKVVGCGMDKINAVLKHIPKKVK